MGKLLLEPFGSFIWDEEEEGTEEEGLQSVGKLGF